MSGQSEELWCDNGRGRILKRALSSTARSSVKSCVSWPEVELIETRSLGAKALKKRVAESLTNTVSSMDMCTSSKTMETNRCGNAAAFTAAGSASAEGLLAPGADVSGTACVSGFSMANEVMV